MGYTLLCGERKLGIATDMGIIARNVTEALIGCEAVILESNYDRLMLESGPYPYHLKRRIASKTGHLENAQSALMALFLARNGTKKLMLAHLSKENNTPETALRTVRSYLEQNNAEMELSVASRCDCTKFI